MKNETSGFAGIKPLIAARFEALKQHTLFNVAYDRDEIVEAYLGAFATPELRQEHNCSACKAFIRQVGGMVVVNADGTVQTLWELDMDAVPETLRASVAALDAYVAGKAIDGLFHHDQPSAGVDKNLDKALGVVWEHFHLKIPSKYVNGKDNRLGKQSAELRETKNVLKRGLDELTPDAIDTVLDLIAQNSLYRGQEHESNVKTFRAFQLGYKEVLADLKDAWCWSAAAGMAIAVSRIRNTSIGTLLVDLSEGMDLDVAVRKFEAMVAPANYKRPTALVTPRMVEEAKKTLESLGLISALDRRRLNTRDLTAAHALFVFRPEKSVKDVFASLTEDQPVDKKTLTKVERVAIADFIDKVLPTAKSVKLLVEREHLGNFVTLTGPADPDAKSLMKWGNSFAWSYSGGVADSIKERVKAAGGKVDGWMGIRLAWHNFDDLDLHLRGPGTAGYHIYFGNKRGMHACLDVDMNVGCGQTREPVENIVAAERLPPGVYKVNVNQFCRREDKDSGYELDIEVNGEVYSFGSATSPRHGDAPDVEFTVLRDGTVKFAENALSKSSSGVVKWGVKTGVFRRVSAVTLSPNHWDTPTGNRHVFFMLEGCVSDEATRPFYNEFLTQELAKDRKTTEVLAGKINVAPAEGAELSGLGFSDTLRGRIYAEVEGQFKRTIEIVF